MKIDAAKFGAVATARHHHQEFSPLHGVLIDDECLIATNKHVLTFVENAVPKHEGQLILNVTNGLVETCGNEEADHVFIDTHMIFVVRADDNILHAEVRNPVFSTYPDWRCVLPKGMGHDAVATFGTPVLETLIATAEMLGSPGFRLFGEEDNGPHWCKYAGENEVATVVMPIRT